MHTPVDSYFEQSRTWDSCSRREEERIARTLRVLPPYLTSVLDVGCGDGRLLHAVARRAEFAVGVDIHVEPLRRLWLPGLRASAMGLPFRSSSFELVMATEILEHLPAADRRRALLEMRRVSKRLVLVSVPFRENLREELCLCSDCGAVFHLYGHMDRFELQSVATLSAGMRVESVLTIVPIRKGRDLAPLYWLAYRLGGAYQAHASARCTACGGPARSGRGNLFGRAMRAAIWLLNRTLPIREEGWLVVLCRKEPPTP
jgi:SAM-dependent methyltransferase